MKNPQQKKPLRQIKKKSQRKIPLIISETTPVGDYTINQLVDKLREKSCQLYFKFVYKPEPDPTTYVMDNAHNNTVPEAGTERFFVLCSRLSIYTTIGADNRHHASNKATKLFGPHWSSITQSHYLMKDHLFETVAEFSRLIKTLPN